MNFVENSNGIDKTWTLFLDRDGVINEECVGSYITNWNEFNFLEGAVDALKILSNKFGLIVIVTNQRGVEKGIMTLNDLRDINSNILQSVSLQGAKIDRIYNCTALLDTDQNRKPNTGMAMQAKADFPNIDFKRSIMIGNSLSDMEFGKRMGMHTVFITTKYEPLTLPHDLIDEQYDSLYDWTLKLVPTAA